MTLLFLPPHSPELMPLERLWCWMKEHDLSNRIDEDEAAIDRACAHIWNRLTPERIQSVTAEPWLEHAEQVGGVLAPHW